MAGSNAAIGSRSDVMGSSRGGQESHTPYFWQLAHAAPTAFSHLTHTQTTDSVETAEGVGFSPDTLPLPRFRPTPVIALTQQP